MTLFFRLIRLAFIDMENMFELIEQKSEVRIKCPLSYCKSHIFLKLLFIFITCLKFFFVYRFLTKLMQLICMLRMVLSNSKMLIFIILKRTLDLWILVGQGSEYKTIGSWQNYNMMFSTWLRRKNDGKILDIALDNQEIFIARRDF